jgi:transposase
MIFHKQVSTFWLKIEGSLFPGLNEELGSLTEKQQQLVSSLEFLRIESHVAQYWGGPGRPPKDRAAIARAFVAKSVYNIPTTRMLLDRLKSDIALRRICGWEKQSAIPSESVFSRAFAEFAENQLAERVHTALIKQNFGESVISHVSRDSTQIEARERPVKKEKETTSKETIKPKRGRPKKGEERPAKPPRRIELQQTMALQEMLDDLPKSCDVGTKKNSKGYKVSWNGYKLHLDVIDGDIPATCILTSASVHDSQVAIPLAELSSTRFQNFYDLMDSAYDVPEIYKRSQTLGHVPIIDKNPRRDKNLKEQLNRESRAKAALNLSYPEEIRYRERSSVERVNGNLKDNYGGRYVRVRGHQKVFCHLMFGIIALTANQILHLFT